MLKKWWSKKRLTYYLSMMRICNRKAEKQISIDDTFFWMTKVHYYADKAVALCKEGES